MSGRIENETELIETYLAPLASGYPGAFGLKDDAALISLEPGHGLAVSTDPIISGVHFFAGDHASDVAWKALAVNVSDLAAKGAKPLAYTMALAFPEAPERTWMEAFASGLNAAQLAFGCHLAGGDTDRTSGPLSISITVFGQVPAGGMVRRTTATVGDHVFVTGTLGDSALGLKIHKRQSTFAPYLTGGEKAFLTGRYLRPSPRVALAPVLLQYASAALDVSDGFIKDLARLAGPTGAGLSIPIQNLPLSPPAAHVFSRERQEIHSIIAGGDDYEIVFAVPPANLDGFSEAIRQLPVQVSELGILEAGQGVAVIDANGLKLDSGPSGYDHFR